MKLPYRLRHLEKHLFILSKFFFRRKTIERKIRERYRTYYRKDLDTRSPIGFREKVFCRIIDINNNGNRLFTELSDKYRVRSFVESRIGPDFLVPLLWSGKNPDKIPFDFLPSQCIAKTNHGCGGNVIIRKDSDRAEIIDSIRSWLRYDYYWADYEYHYHSIERLVVIEQLLIDPVHGAPLDYKFWCFDGKPHIIQVGDSKKSFQSIYSTDWRKLGFKCRPKLESPVIEKPINLQLMLEICEKLSHDFDFVRVDLYNISGQIYFGEMTFTPAGGHFQFDPEHWNEEIGKLWNFDTRRT